MSSYKLWNLKQKDILSFMFTNTVLLMESISSPPPSLFLSPTSSKNRFLGILYKKVAVKTVTWELVIAQLNTLQILFAFIKSNNKAWFSHQCQDLQFIFEDGAIFELDPENHYQLLFTKRQSLEVNIIYNTLQQNHLWEHDLVANKVGLCSFHLQLIDFGDLSTSPFYLVSFIFFLYLYSNLYKYPVFCHTSVSYLLQVTWEIWLWY